MKVKLFVFLLFITSICFAQKRDQFEFFPKNKYIGFHFDDDFLFIGNRDEQYTGGLQIEYIQRIKKSNKKRNLLNPFANGNRFFNFTLGANLYTPYNVSDSLIILNDRPFSSYIFSAIGYTAYNTYLQQKLTTELYLGFIGSDLPGKIQEKIHTVGDSPPAFGWQHKIGKTEVLLPNIRVNYQGNILNMGKIKPLLIDWIQLGNVFELNTGLYLNNAIAGLRIIGYSSKPKSRSAAHYYPDPVYNNATKTKEKKLKFNIYFSPKVEFVLYNTSLQSLPWLYSPYSIPANEITRKIIQLEGGINITYNRFSLSYILKARSKEFVKHQQNWHSWAGITMGFSF